MDWTFDLCTFPSTKVQKCSIILIMTLLCLIPNIFYEDVSVGLALFRDGLGFEVVHEDLSAPKGPWYIIKKDSVKIHLVQDAEFAAKDRPEIRIQTDDIDALYARVKASHPDLLHPNCKEVKNQPWGLKEFGLLDASNVCVIIQQ